MQNDPPRSPVPRKRLGDRPTIGHLMTLIAGAAFGFWVLGKAAVDSSGPISGRIVIWVVTVLGSLSVMGVPILLLERFRRKGPPNWEAGRVSWFAQSSAAWLLWPPIIANRFRANPPAFGGDATSALCFYYGTPLMAVYMTAALVCGGGLRKSRRRRIRRSFRESFGLVLAMLWAMTGLYVHWLIYSESLR